MFCRSQYRSEERWQEAIKNGAGARKLTKKSDFLYEKHIVCKERENLQLFL